MSFTWDISLRPSALLTSAVATTTVLLWTSAARKHSRERKRLGDFKHSSPWYFPVDILYAIRARSFDSFLAKRRDALQADNFYIHLLGFSKRPTLVVTKPEDQVDIMRKEGKMKLVSDLPDTVHQLHGTGTVQNVSGQRHNTLRKIFANLLSPAALDSFVPCMFEVFGSMYADLEHQSQEKDVVIIRDTICTAQFFLMSKILYGMSPDNTPMADLESLREDFKLQLEALFVSPGSYTFKKGLAASKRIRKYLSERFDKILEARRKVRAQGLDEEKKEEQQDSKKSLPPVGNVMECIADALLQHGMDRDPMVLSDIQDNLNLLLEASHGNIIEMTTNTLFYINHPDNADKLAQLRKEVASLGDQQPTYATIKGEMPFAEACIKEAMRLAPIIGANAYAMKDELNVTFKGQQITGPVTFLLSFSQNYKDASLFPDPETFLPERWVSGSKEEVSDRARLAYRPFSIGRHICLGYQLALLVMKASLHSFASNETRKIDFDADKVSIKIGFFPYHFVSEGLPGKVMVVKEDE